MTARTVRTDYAAVNASGVTVRTFGDPFHGKAWVRDNACLHDGLTLEEVTITARRIYRPRVVKDRPDFSIPAMPAGEAA